MSQFEDVSVSVSPRTSGRLSHSSGPLTDSSPVSPSEIDDIKYGRANNAGVSLNGYLRPPGGGGKTVGRRLKDGRRGRCDVDGHERTQSTEARLKETAPVLLRRG